MKNVLLAHDTFMRACDSDPSRITYRPSRGGGAVGGARCFVWWCCLIYLVDFVEGNFLRDKEDCIDLEIANCIISLSLLLISATGFDFFFFLLRFDREVSIVGVEGATGVDK